MTAKICAPIPAPTVQQALSLVKKAEKKRADLIEFRLDYLKKVSNIEDLVLATKLPKIATIRPSAEGGRYKGKESNRVHSLLEAAEAGCEFVDIEIRTEEVGEVIKQVKRLGTKAIVSYHDFHSTPDPQKLIEIFRKQASIGADVCKIISTAKTLQDNLRILDFVLKASKKAKVVSFAMGRLGLVSRVLSPVYGASFTFASVEQGTESASGQLTLDEMKNIYRSMRLE